MTRTTTAAVAAPAATFLAPDPELARTYSVGSTWERRVLEEALVPTLREFARWLLGERGCPTRGEVIYATPEGLRAFLLEDAIGPDRPGCSVTTAMVAYAWHVRLTPQQREALACYAATAETLRQETLFAAAG